MAQSFDDDLHIVEESDIDPELLAALAFPDDLNVIQGLDDEPNDVGGLTAAELKAKFDQAGLTIQRYINETLIPSVVAADATENARAKAEEAREAAEEARENAEKRREEAASHRPYVSEAGSLMVWDMETAAYKDTGVVLKGEKGDPGQKGEKGDPGQDGALIPLGSGVFAMGISEDGHLLVAVSEQDAAPPLEINAEGHLIYKINS